MAHKHDSKRIALKEPHELQYIKKIAKDFIKHPDWVSFSNRKLIRLAKAFLKLTNQKGIKEMTSLNEKLSGHLLYSMSRAEDLESELTGWKISLIIAVVIAFALGIVAGKALFS